MSYIAEISRRNPSCFLFLIDQSGSMGDKFGASGFNQTKAEGVADALNKLLQNLVLKCAKAEGVRDYFNVGVIGYGATIGPAFSGPLAGRELVPISEIGIKPSRIEDRQQKISDGAGGIVEKIVKFPTWFDPLANGPTPMCKILQNAKTIISGWLSVHPDCFPPIVINISDGEATDGDPSTIAEELKQLTSTDGNVLLFNLHLSSSTAPSVTFPDSEEALVDEHARLLYKMSSVLPENMRVIAQQEGFNVSENSRSFVFNAELVTVIQFLDIGTRATNLR